MEQNELKRLMVDDWVYNTHNRQNEQVQQILELGVMLDYNDIYSADDIEPVKLTPEILERNGFTNYGESWYIPTKNDEDIHIMIGFHRRENVIDVWQNLKVSYRKTTVNKLYVHQLQQVLRICGVKKEIKL